MFLLLTLKLLCVAIRQSNPDIAAGLPNILLRFLPLKLFWRPGPTCSPSDYCPAFLTTE